MRFSLSFYSIQCFCTFLNRLKRFCKVDHIELKFLCPRSFWLPGHIALGNLLVLKLKLLTYTFLSPDCSFKSARHHKNDNTCIFIISNSVGILVDPALNDNTCIFIISNSVDILAGPALMIILAFLSFLTMWVYWQVQP